GDDLQIIRSDGTSFTVDLSDAVTVADVIAAINVASGGMPAAGVGITASFSTMGNGIVLTDTAGGPDEPKITQLNFSRAAEDLGLDVPAVGGVITGRDVHPVKAAGIFNNIAKLRDALQTGNQQAITEASEA